MASAIWRATRSATRRSAALVLAARLRVAEHHGAEMPERSSIGTTRAERTAS